MLSEEQRFPFFHPKLREDIGTVRRAAEEHGRDPETIGIECHMFRTGRKRQRERVKAVAKMGVMHSVVGCMGLGLTPETHIDELKRI